MTTYTVLANGMVQETGLSFEMARVHAEHMVVHLRMHKVLVRKALPQDDVRVAAINGILADTKRSCPTGGVWKDPVAYKNSRYAGTI